jgi:lipopolysaccharide transport system ATP-binding protein
MSALLELGLGFSAELTVRENVELYAAVLGYPRKEVARRVEEAIHFAGLERFRDAKLKNLSTGMRARLGFATALQAESDILLLDEIMAVGDVDFQLKCLDVFEAFKRQRRTIVLVTHDLGTVQRFCDSALLLEHGRIKAEGDPDAVIPVYLQSVGQLQVALSDLVARERNGDGAILVQRVWFEDERGRTIGRARSGDRVVLVALFEIVTDTDEPVFGFGLKAEDGALVYSFNTHWQGTRTQVMRVGQCVELRVPLVAALRNGRYDIQIGAGNRDMTVVHDLVDRAASLVIHGSLARDGVADLQAQMNYRIVDEAPSDTAAAAHGRPGRGGRL